MSNKLTIYKESDLELAWVNNYGTKCFNPRNLPLVNKDAFIVKDHMAYNTETHRFGDEVPVIRVTSKESRPSEFHPKGYPILEARIGINCNWINVFKDGFGYLKLEGFNKDSATDLAMRILTVFHSRPQASSAWLVEDNFILHRKDTNL